MPAIHPIPQVKLIEYPAPFIVTLEDYKYYLEACEAFEVAGQEDQWSLEELEFKYPGLDENAACSFAVYGLPTHKWLNMEQDIATTIAHVETLRASLNSAYRQMVRRYQIANKSTEEIKESLK